VAAARESRAEVEADAGAEAVVKRYGPVASESAGPLSLSYTIPIWAELSSGRAHMCCVVVKLLPSPSIIITLACP
jgi:hypothetical protein